MNSFLSRPLPLFQRSKVDEERVAYWDNLKFIMILFVVIGHLAQVYYNSSVVFKSIVLFIYAFHMPVLFFISGRFFKLEDAKRRFLFYFLCGLVLKLCFSICDFLLGEKVTFWLLYEGDIPWFMFSLGCYYLLMTLLKKINSTLVLIICILLSCMIGYDTSNGDYLVLHRTIVFFPFFYFGALCANDRIEKIFTTENNMRRVFLYMLAAFLLLLWGLICYYKVDLISELLHVFKGKNAYSESIVHYGLLVRLLCYSISVMTGAAFLILCPHRNIFWITSMGRRTINVYFWHWLMYKVLSRIFQFQRLFYFGPLGKAAYLFIGVVICCVTASISLFNWPMNIIKKSIPEAF